MIVLTEQGAKTDWWQNSRLFLGQLIESIHKNVTYNDYGWVEEVEFDTKIRPDFRSIFVHQKVWNKIQKVPPTEMDKCMNSCMENEVKLENKIRKEVLGKKDEKTKKILQDYYGRVKMLDEELIKVIRFAFNCRINLNAGFAYKGCQHYEAMHYDFYHKLIGSLVNKMKKDENQEN